MRLDEPRKPHIRYWLRKNQPSLLWVTDEFGIALWDEFLSKWKYKWKFIEGSWSFYLLVISLVWAHNSFSQFRIPTFWWGEDASWNNYQFSWDSELHYHSNYYNLETCLNIISHQRRTKNYLIFGETPDRGTTVSVSPALLPE
jgi:hypothetical protein